MATSPLAFELKKVTKQFSTKKLPALANISLSLEWGRVMGVVGESGSGKSTLAKIIAGNESVTSGEVFVLGVSVEPPMSKENRNAVRQVQYVYQDASTCMNPKWRIREILFEPLEIIGSPLAPKEKESRLLENLAQVGLTRDLLERYPHEISGGQRQRVNLARALMADPQMLICDEVTASLDVTVQAQILELLCELNRVLKLTILFISHDLWAVNQVSSEIAVFYRGELVERGQTQKVLQRPQHPYTRLLASQGRVEYRRSANLVGCRFLESCSQSELRCKAKNPLLQNGVACHFPLKSD